MTTAAWVSAIVLATSLDAGGGGAPLVGTWRLLSYRRTVVATGETADLLGKSPQGFIGYGRDGRMFVLIVKEGRAKPQDIAKLTDEERAELFKTMVSYAGTYTFDGKTVTHHVDISWNQLWTGTDQVRNVRFDGRNLVISTNPQPSSIDGKVSVTTLTWEKVDGPATNASAAPARATAAPR
jgi:Lipocalin-like domain